MGIRFRNVVLVATALGMLAVPSMANAKSMESLVQDGFKVSKLTRGKSGLAGWYVTKGDQKYFCPIRLALAYIDDKDMMALTTQGAQMIIDRKTFDDYLGGPDPTMPYWKDVVVGKVRPGDAKPCLPSQ